MEVPFAAEISSAPSGVFIVKALQRLFEELQAQPWRIGGNYIRQGAGSPQGVVVGSTGDLYLRQDSQLLDAAGQPASAVLYVKIGSNDLPTGWLLVGMMTATGLPSPRIPFGDGSGVLQHSANLSWDGTTLSATQIVTAASNGKVTTNQIWFPATQVADTNVNALDDYEEGTWTPTDASGAGLGLTNNGSRYLKIGKLVYVDCDVTYPVTANGAAAVIGSLPFTVDVTSGAGCSKQQSTGLNINFMAIANTTTVGLYLNTSVAVTNAQCSAAVVAFAAIFRASA